MHHLKYAATVAALALIGALGVAGCGSSTTSPSTIADISVPSTFVNGHSHTVNISASDQMHPADQVYTTSNAAGHTHTLVVTAKQLTSIATGESVTVTSGVSAMTGNHTHDFIIQTKK